MNEIAYTAEDANAPTVSALYEVTPGDLDILRLDGQSDRFPGQGRGPRRAYELRRLLGGKLILGEGDYEDGSTIFFSALSVSYDIDRATVSGYLANEDHDVDGYGLGASDDLDSGATLLGGYANDKTDDADALDFGVKEAF